MRQENIERLTYFNVKINSPNYLVYKHLFRDLESAIRRFASGSVLDIGCGNKPYESLFKGKIQNYVGCDIVQSSNKSVDILCPATEIPIGDGEFSTVFSSQVIEHVGDHQKMLSEAFRILKKGGHIILSAPMCWEHHEEPHDFFRFTKYGLATILEKAGFKIIEIKSNGGKWALLGQMTQNILTSSTQNKKGIFRKFIRLIYLGFLKFAINLFYDFLEKIDKDEDFITLNFVVVAKKE